MAAILLTSAGRRVELVEAFRSSPLCRQHSLQIVTTDVDPLAPAMHRADKALVTSRSDDPQFIAQLEAIVRRHQIRLILPLIDPDIPLLAIHRRRLERCGAVVGVGSPTAITLCADKWKTTRLFQSLGLATPRSWLPGHRRPPGIRFPLFVKPREGSASQDTYCLTNASQLAFFQNYVPRPLLQEYIEGQEITADVVCAPGGRVIAICLRQRIAVRAGEIAKGVTVWDESIAAACQQIAYALGAPGPLTIQCICRNGTAYFTEVNARLGGGVPLAIAAGIDVPGLLAASLLKLDYRPPQLGDYRQGLFLTRFDQSLFVTSEQLASVGQRSIAA
jgi:carbamoyl-phosphate synthase large subunit